MPAIFVLDVPEFREIVDHALATPGFTVKGPLDGYFKVEAHPTLTLARKTLGFKPAVWHGSMTGGLLGRIDRFDNDVLVLVEEPRP